MRRGERRERKSRRIKRETGIWRGERERKERQKGKGGRLTCREEKREGMCVLLLTLLYFS